MENRRLKQTAYSFLIFILLSFQSLLAAEDVMYREVRVGVILDMDSGKGKAIYRCITRAISDFYEANSHYRTRIVLETRDTKGEPLSSALDLLENAKVEAIIGPNSRFSFSTSTILDHNPYFLRIAQDEFRGISAMVDSFQGKNVILIFEKTANGREMASYMVSEFQEKNIHVTYTSLILTSATNEQIRQEFHKLQNMQTTTFVIHTPHSLASNVFSVAKEVGMMGEGYIWIVTSKITNFLSTMDTDVIQTMQGVVGFKSYIPESKGIRKEFYDLMDNGIWAYDAVYALAMAIESVQTEQRLTGTPLPNHISRIKFMKGRTVSKPMQVINVIGKADRRLGFWMANGEFVREIGKTNSSSNNGLIFPGGTTNRRRLQMNRKKLRILVPLFGGFPNLVQMAVDPRTNLPTVSGYCGDVFRAAFNALNYGVDVEYIPLEDGRTYNDLIDKVYNKEFDAAIGDITIMTNRTRYVDFTLPISDLGIGTLVRNEKKSMWFYLNPLSADLWFTFAAFFLVLGFVIWFTEHRINKEFQGSTNEQIGKTLWFAFSTLVYAHREKLQSNLSRFVVTVWVFVVLVLSSSYTATLSSLLTVQQIASKGGLVQFQGNSPVGESIFNNLKSSDGIIEPLTLPEDYVKALRSGKVGAIIDEIFYIKTVLGMYSPDEFSLVATSSTTNGFAFAFQKDSPMTKDMSSEIAKLRADGTLKALEDKWLKRQFSIMSKDLSAPSPTILNLHRFRGLFLISGVSMALAFLMSVVYLVREKCHGKSKIEILRCIFPTSVQVHALQVHALDNVVQPAV